MVQRDQWDTYGGAKKLIFLIREIDDGTIASPIFDQTQGREVDESRGSNGISKIAQWALMRIRWTLPLTNGRK